MLVCRGVDDADGSLYTRTSNERAAMYKDKDGEIHETGDEARDAVDVKGMTTVLVGSIALVVVAFVAIIWWWR